MIGTGLFILSLLILGALFGIFRRSNYEESSAPKAAGKLIGVVIASLIIAFATPIAAKVVNAGNVGIKVSIFGQDRGVSKIEYVTGLVFYNPWISHILEFPISQRHIDYEENAVITKGGFQATIKPSFNYSVKAGDVSDMYQNLKKEDLDDVEKGWLKNAILSSVNDVANLYTVDSIFNHRAEFEADIIKECNKRTIKWFQISQLRTNIVPPKEIADAIANKTRSVQEAQGAIQRTIVAEAEAKEKIARAKGDSAQMVISASGKSEAVKKEQQYLTPLYIEYLKTQKWNGAYPTTMLGSNTSTFLNIK